MGFWTQEGRGERLLALAAEGYSLQELAGEFDQTTDAVRHALRRRGGRAIGVWERTVVERAEEMRPTEAVRYLLGVLRCVAGTLVAEEHHPVDDLGHHMSPQQRSLLIALWEHEGRVLTLEGCCDAMDVASGQPNMTPRHVAVVVCRLRKVVAGVATIENVHGRGYRLRRLE